MPATPSSLHPARLALRLALRIACFLAILLLPAGTWRWWEAWAVVALYAGYVGIVVPFLRRHDPELLAERLDASPVQDGQKGWDKLLTAGLTLSYAAVLILPGLDVVRFGWTEALPLGIELLALTVHLPCFAWLSWVLRENSYLSRVVKIDRKRGQSVVTTGPYALVRHPMYVAMIVMMLALPLALGSRVALLPAFVSIALLIVRTRMEDTTLHAELDGYREYAGKTRYRLVPGLW